MIGTPARRGHPFVPTKGCKNGLGLCPKNPTLVGRNLRLSRADPALCFGQPSPLRCVLLSLQGLTTLQEPQAEIGTDCVIVLGIRQYAGVLFLVIIRFSLAEKSCGVFAREKWRQRKRGAVGRLAPVNATRNVGRYLCPQKLYVLLSNKGNHRKAWRKLPRCRLTGGIQL